MKFALYLQKHEPLAYKTLFEAAKNNRINHAYLLTGENGTPLMETATFFAKTILCQHPNPLADESCNSCERIDHGSYADLRVLGTEETSIKKEEVNSLIDDFSQTARERKGIMVYIINLVENMTVEAVNSLLKFLEEPTGKTYAILTSQNPSRVLPTIVSRCEVVRILPLSQTEVISDALEDGVKQEDAEILSYFVSSGEAIKEESQSPEFDKAKSAFIAALKGLGKGRKDAVFAFENEVIPLVNGKEGARYFFDMLSLAYKDLISLSLSRSTLLTSYAKLIEPLTKWVKNPQKDLGTILHFRGEVELNINIPLLINEAGISLVKEWKHGN
jgi:DNA polymerase-3 subunit delta'